METHDTNHVNITCPLTGCKKSAITCTPKPSMKHIYGSNPLYTTCDESAYCTNNACPYKVKN